MVGGLNLPLKAGAQKGQDDSSFKSSQQEEKKQALMKLPVLHRYLRALHLGVLQGAGRQEGRKGEKGKERQETGGWRSSSLKTDLRILGVAGAASPFLVPSLLFLSSSSLSPAF